MNLHPPESQLSRFVHRYFSNPRMILLAFGVLMFGISISTLQLTPNYLVWPYAYVGTGFVGGLAAWWAMISPGKWSLAIAGGLIAGACSTRGIGLAMTLITNEWRGDASFTLLVGSLAYFAILTMLPPVWFRYLIPWTIDKVTEAR